MLLSEGGSTPIASNISIATVTNIDIQPTLKMALQKKDSLLMKKKTEVQWDLVEEKDNEEESDVKALSSMSSVSKVSSIKTS